MLHSIHFFGYICSGTFLIQKSILDTKLNFYKVPFLSCHRMMQSVLVNPGTTLAFQKNVTFVFPYFIAFGLSCT
jgi:hypothetical protein